MLYMGDGACALDAHATWPDAQPRSTAMALVTTRIMAKRLPPVRATWWFGTAHDTSAGALQSAFRSDRGRPRRPPLAPISTSRQAAFTLGPWQRATDPATALMSNERVRSGPIYRGREQRHC